MTPTARTLKKLRADGYVCQVVEQTIPHTFIKRDLFGFADILAIKPGEILAVQATDATNVAHRVKKVEALDSLQAWWDGGGRFEIWGWTKGKRGDEALRRVIVGFRVKAT